MLVETSLILRYNIVSAESGWKGGNGVAFGVVVLELICLIKNSEISSASLVASQSPLFLQTAFSPCTNSKRKSQMESDRVLTDQHDFIVLKGEDA